MSRTPYSNLRRGLFCCTRRPGGDKINMVFEGKLPAALKKLPFDKHLSIQSKASA